MTWHGPEGRWASNRCPQGQRLLTHRRPVENGCRAPPPGGDYASVSPQQRGVDPAVELPAHLGQHPDPLEAAGPVQRLARVVRQRDHREHLVHAVGAQPAEQLVVQRPAEALPARRVVQVDRDLAGAGVRRPRAVGRRVGVAHDLRRGAGGVGDEQVVAGLGAGQPGLPVAQPRRLEVEGRDRGADLLVVDGRDSREVGRICAAHGHGFHDDVAHDRAPASSPTPRTGPGCSREPCPECGFVAADVDRADLGAAAPRRRASAGPRCCASPTAHRAARRADLVAAGVRLPRPRRAPHLRRAAGPDARARTTRRSPTGTRTRPRSRGATTCRTPRSSGPSWSAAAEAVAARYDAIKRRARGDLGPPRAARQRQRVHRRLHRALPPARRAGGSARSSRP